MNSFTYDPSLVLTTSKCEINVENIGCSAAVGSKTIVMTLKASKVPLELNAGEWMFTIWVNGHEPTAL